MQAPAQSTPPPVGCIVRPGATCASRPPSTQRACRNDWVEAQINATAIPGADCASRGPANYQTCINDWVKSQQALNGGAPGSTCASLALQ